MSRMTQKKLRYSEFYDRIDVDAVEEALGFDKISEDGKGNDIGYCLDLHGLHSNGDTTGKMAIHREKRVVNCFVCGGGSLLSLAMEALDMEHGEATRWLYQFASDDLRTDDEFVSEFMSSFDEQKTDRIPLPFFNERVLDKFDTRPQPLGKSRGISDIVWEEFGIRYSSETKRRAPKKHEMDGDYYGPSVILPHFFKGRLVGWQNRWLDEDRPKWVPKYTMTGDFPRNETLYNYDRASKSKNPVVVVESVMSVLLLESLGFPAVATFGSNTSKDQVKLLRSIDKLVLARDLDSAGEKWEESLINSLSDYTDMYIANYDAYDTELPSAWDVGDLAYDDDPKSAASKIIDDAVLLGTGFISSPEY